MDDGKECKDTVNDEVKKEMVGMAREVRRGLRVGEELILGHQDLQQCLNSGFTLWLLKEGVKWENAQALPPG